MFSYSVKTVQVPAPGECSPQGNYRFGNPITSTDKPEQTADKKPASFALSSRPTILRAAIKRLVSHNCPAAQAMENPLRVAVPRYW